MSGQAPGQTQVDAFGDPVRDPEPDIPQWLVLSRKLWIISALAGFVQTFFQLADRRSLVEMQQALQPGLDQDQVNASVNGTILFTLLSSLAAAAVYVMLANRMVQGRNWARIVLLVFGIVTVLMTVVNVIAVSLLGNELVQQLIGRPIQGWELVVMVVIAAMHLAATVVMFRPETNRYFHEMRQRPHAGQKA